MTARVFAYSLGALFLLACAGPAKAIELRFLSDLNWETGTMYSGTEVGGLSGLAYDPSSDSFLSISDDKSEVNDARFYRLAASVDGGGLKVELRDVVYLKNENGKPFKKKTIDPEGIAVLPDGSVLISSEGMLKKDPRISPGIFHLDRAGSWISALPIPEQFLPEPTGDQTRGVRNNNAFESVTLDPASGKLYTATEEGLVQDEDITLSRIIEFNPTRSLPFEPARQFAYRTDDVDGLNLGISEMQALGDSKLLVLERGFDHQAKVNTIRIYEADCSGATDVAAEERLVGRNVVACSKRLVLDLDSILPRLSQGYQSMDNLEGMAFGPTLPSGGRLFLMVSDNNFSQRQRTQFLAFEAR